MANKELLQSGLLAELLTEILSHDAGAGAVTGAVEGRRAGSCTPGWRSYLEKRTHYCGHAPEPPSLPGAVAPIQGGWF